MKNIVLIFLSLFLGIVILLFIWKESETIHSHYGTYEELVSIPNIFEVGWIPRWLPSSATNIYEAHNIDTNEVWMAFSFTKSDDFFSNCQNISVKKSNFFSTEQVKRSPAFMNEMLKKDNELKFYKCDNRNNQVLAVDKGTLRAYIVIW